MSRIKPVTGVPLSTHWHQPLVRFWNGLVSNPQPAEVLAFSIFILYILVFMYGGHLKKRKRKVLDEVIKPTLANQFAIVEDSPSDAFNELVCYASGRRGCRSCTAKIKLKNSHDLLYFTFLDRLSKNEDRILFSIDFLPEDSISPFVYSLANVHFQPSFLKVAPDVRAYTKQMPLGYLPETIICMTENRECVILTPRLVQALRASEDLFRCLHVSDQIDLTELDPPDRGVRLWTRLPETQEECALLEELLAATLELVDVVLEKTENDLTVYPTQEAREAAIAARMRARITLARSFGPKAGPTQQADLNEAAAFLSSEQHDLDRKKDE